MHRFFDCGTIYIQQQQQQCVVFVAKTTEKFLSFFFWAGERAQLPIFILRFSPNAFLLFWFLWMKRTGNDVPNDRKKFNQLKLEWDKNNRTKSNKLTMEKFFDSAGSFCPSQKTIRQFATFQNHQTLPHFRSYSFPQTSESNKNRQQCHRTK